MSKNRLKLLIWLALLTSTLILVYYLITGVSNLIAYFSTGADPRSALNLLPGAPPDLNDRLVWQPDRWAGSPLPAFSRDKIAAAYLRAWAQWNISYEAGEPYGLKTYFSGQALAGVKAAVEEPARAGWQIRQSDLIHNLELTFYADGGTVVTFTDHNVTVVQRLTHPETGQNQVVETTATYDVVMLLEDGNWLVRFWQRRLDPVSNETDQVWNREPAPAGRFATVQGDELWLDGQPYEIHGINYYPQATPWRLFWPNYNPKVTAGDLAIIRALGLNTVRIFIPFEQFIDEANKESYYRHLDDFLAQAEANDLKVMVTLFDHRTDHTLANWAADDRHLADLIPRYAANRTIIAWDLKNEPDGDFAFNSPEQVQAWLRHIAAQVRRHDPNHLLTIGWQLPESAPALADVVDFISYHFFFPAEEYPRRLAELQAAAQGKPLFLQEFVMPTRNTIVPGGHTEAEQAFHYAEMLTIQRLGKNIGYMNWTLYDFAIVPKEQFGSAWQRAQQANMGLIRRDGTLKPAAYVVRPGVDLAAVPPPPPAFRLVKPFWLLSYGLITGLVGASLGWFYRARLGAGWQRVRERARKRFDRWLFFIRF